MTYFVIERLISGGNIVYGFETWIVLSLKVQFWWNLLFILVNILVFAGDNMHCLSLTV